MPRAARRGPVHLRVNHSPGAQRRPAHRRTPSRICDEPASVSALFDHSRKLSPEPNGHSLMDSSRRGVMRCLLFVPSALGLPRRGRGGGWEAWANLSHLALNSSKDSSWCSDRRRDEVLKVGRATTRGRATAGRRAVARKKEVAGPRAAMRRRDMIFFSRSLGGEDAVGCATEETGLKREREKRKGVDLGDARRRTRPCKSEVEWRVVLVVCLVCVSRGRQACPAGRSSFQLSGPGEISTSNHFDCAAGPIRGINFVKRLPEGSG